jgi:hypothetical protein
MHLKTLAKRWESEDGQLVLFMVPFTPVRVDVVNDELAAIAPVATWSAVHNTYVGYASYVIDAEFSDALSTERQALKAFLADRSGNTAEDWNNFQFAASAQVMKDFWAAYRATRDTAIEQAAPADDSEKKDENAA